MPTPPRKGESTDAFISRCHAYMAEHHSEMKPEQRSGFCYGMARDAGRSVPKPKEK